jgi:hypothetical protein
MEERSFVLGYFVGRRGFRRWTGRARTRPKMPSAAWRTAAVLCTAAGVALAWAVFGSDAGLRMIGGGVVGFVLGMYLVETVWERRRPMAPVDDPSATG